MSDTIPALASEKLQRRWFQFSLAEVLDCVFIFALLAGLIVPGLKHSANTPPNPQINEPNR